jgi:hypothetical protein
MRALVLLPLALVPSMAMTMLLEFKELSDTRGACAPRTLFASTFEFYSFFMIPS